MKNKDNHNKLEQILLSAEETADVIGISRSSLFDFNSRGIIPSPVKIGRRVLWRRKEIEEWTDAGCPTREKWNLMQTTISMKEVSN